eukprot:8907364-Pyramimonas_sp.AAC.1
MNPLAAAARPSARRASFRARAAATRLCRDATFACISWHMPLMPSVTGPSGAGIAALVPCACAPASNGAGW